MTSTNLDISNMTYYHNPILMRPNRLGFVLSEKTASMNRGFVKIEGCSTNELKLLAVSDKDAKKNMQRANLLVEGYVFLDNRNFPIVIIGIVHQYFSHITDPQQRKSLPFALSLNNRVIIKAEVNHDNPEATELKLVDGLTVSLKDVLSSNVSTFHRAGIQLDGVSKEENMCHLTFKSNI